MHTQTYDIQIFYVHQPWVDNILACSIQYAMYIFQFHIVGLCHQQKCRIIGKQCDRQCSTHALCRVFCRQFCFVAPYSTDENSSSIHGAAQISTFYPIFGWHKCSYDIYIFAHIVYNRSMERQRQYNLLFVCHCGGFGHNLVSLSISECLM